MSDSGRQNRWVRYSLGGVVAVAALWAGALPSTADEPTTRPSITTRPAGPATEPVSPAAQPAATTTTQSTLAGGPATGPSTAPAVALAPTTAPATRPADPRIAELIHQLAKSDWRSRQKAAPELVRAGDDAVAQLEELVRNTDNIDVRTTAQDALRQIADNRLNGPSFVTLHLKDASPKAAFEELAKQAFFDLKTWPDNLWTENAAATKGDITIDAERQPFWNVMRDLTAKTGMELREMNGAIRLMRGGGMMNNGRPVIAGAFLITANQITRNQTVQIPAQGQGKTDESFSIQMTAWAEPKLKVLRASNQLKIEECVDDKGNSLLLGPTDPNRMAGYYGSGSGSFSLFAPLKYPQNPGTKISKLKASATFALQTRSQKLEIPDLMNVKEAVHVLGGTRVTVKEFKKVGDNYQLRIVMNNDTGIDQLQSTVHNRLKIEDDKGQSLDQRGWGSSGRVNELEMTITYAKSNRMDGRPTGEPTKLVWEVPTETRDINVSFEFNDLPLPR